MALLGCNVVSTDQTEVLPLLMRNVERNTSRILQTNPDSGIPITWPRACTYWHVHQQFIRVSELWNLILSALLYVSFQIC